MTLLLYQLLFPLVGLAVAARLLLSGRGRALAEGPGLMRQRLGLLNREELRRLNGNGKGPGETASRRVIWLHAASVGEVGAAGLLAAAIAARPGRPRVLLTASTAAGLERAERTPGVDLAALAPADFYPAVAAFLRRARPDALVLVETELWPMTLRLAAARGLKLAVANGRLTARSFRRYRWIRGLVSPALRLVSRAALQTPEDLERFIELGLPREAAAVTGNLKWDAPPADEESRELTRREIGLLGWSGDPVWVAGSVWPGQEEDAVLDSFLELRRRHPRLRLVLAPRHLERLPESLKALGARAVACALLSRLHEPRGPGPPDCLVLDRLGHLRRYYTAAAAAFVGGTLAPVGGHNLLEPALAGAPVLFGPHTQSAAEPARALESSGGGLRVEDAAELARAIERLLSDPVFHEGTSLHARQAAQGLAGATRRTLEFLEPVLFP